jgi:glucosylceramidase
MKNSTSRRNFLKISGAGLTAALGAKASPAEASSGTAARGTATPAKAFPAGPPESPTGSLAVRVTDAARKFAEAPAVEWRSALAGAPGSDAIMLDPTAKSQEYLGMGGALTDAACYMFNQLSEDARKELFHEMFHPSEMGLSVCRICIGSSDYAREVYSFDEGDPDPELKRFSIDHDRTYILPILSQARAVNPDLYLFASPWSPPGWMKPDNTMLGGCMHPKSYEAYANYFVKFLLGYEAAGVHVNSVSSQNEVDTEQNGRMPACAWPQEYEISFVRDHLGPALAKNNLDTKIWLLDHNYNLWGRVICSLDAAGVKDYCNSIAWHGYVGTPDMMTKVHEAHPDAEMFWTEGGPDITSKDYLTDWSKWCETFTGVYRNWCRCMIGWNLALDENGKPNVGPFSCGGTVTINSQTKEITRSGHFWAMNHFSRSIQRGAVRFNSESGPSDVFHVAFENPGGKRALILTNPGPEKKIQIAAGDSIAEASLPPDSVTTLAW